MASKISVQCASVIGRRAENQDACWAAAYGSPKGCVRAAIVVSDGMGGALGGARASRIAVDAIRRQLENKPPSLAAVEPWLADAFAQAHDEIVEAGADPSLRGMGCTLVVVLAVGSEAIVAHVGDSRAHLVGHREAQRLTRDHSAVQDAIDRGLYTADEVGSKPEVAALASALTRHLGEGGAPTPDIIRIPFPAGTAILACTDGLTGSVVHSIVTEAELVGSVTATRGLPEAARSLLALAYRKGSTDNITVALMEKGRMVRSVRGGSRRTLAAVLGVALVAGMAATAWILIRPEFPWKQARHGKIHANSLETVVGEQPEVAGTPAGADIVPADSMTAVDKAAPEPRGDAGVDGRPGAAAGERDRAVSADPPEIEVAWSNLPIPDEVSGMRHVRREGVLHFRVAARGEEKPRVVVQWRGDGSGSRDVSSGIDGGIGKVRFSTLGLSPGVYRIRLSASAGDAGEESEEIGIRVVGG